MYVAVTRAIEVAVEPSYLTEESDADAGRHVWAYRVMIRNGSPRAVQLLARRWRITDGNGLERQVEGPGVVGLQPTIPPGAAFEYSSGCPLPTPTGIMVGSYRMVDENGAVFDVDIPAFPLDIPGAPRILN